MQILEQQLEQQELAEMQQQLQAQQQQQNPISQLLNGLDDGDDGDDGGLGQDTLGGSSQSGASQIYQQIQQMEQMQQQMQLLSLLSHLSSLEGAAGNGAASSGGATVSGSGSSSAGPASGQTAFAQTFDVKSTGDPHITANVDGQTSSSTNMNAQGDLVDLDQSVSGGYEVATSTSSANAKGVTYNNGVQVTLGGGDKIVDAFDGAGKQTVTISSGTLSMTVKAGQTVALGDNETATLDLHGKLTIKATGNNGSTVQTVVTNNGKGLDVDTSGTNAYIHGYGADQAVNNQAAHTKKA